jgi:hypothetical protein
MHTLLADGEPAVQRQFDKQDLDHVLAVTRRLIDQHIDIAEQVVNGTMTAEQANAAIDALNVTAQKIGVRS